MNQAGWQPRVVFLSVDDEFAGAMQRQVLERHSSWVVGSIISTNAIYKKSPLQAGLFVLHRSGPRYLAEMFRMKVLRTISGSNAGTVPSRLAAEHGVETCRSRNINDPESLAQLRKWSPDLVISTNFSHYIGASARAVARIGTWNLHKSYLPMYRGMAPSFYALLNGESHVGATLHVVDLGFDTGDIVRQVKVSVVEGDSVYSLNRKTSEAGGQMLAQVLEESTSDGVRVFPQPDGSWSSFTYPSRNDIRRFLALGLRF